MATLFIKSLLTSLYQREDLYPSLAKRGKGRFSDFYKFNFETVNNYRHSCESRNPVFSGFSGFPPSRE